MTQDEIIANVLIELSRAKSTRDVDSIFDKLEHKLAIVAMPKDSKVRFWSGLRDRLPRKVDKAQAADSLGDLYSYAKDKADKNARSAS